MTYTDFFNSIIKSNFCVAFTDLGDHEDEPLYDLDSMLNCLNKGGGFFKIYKADQPSFGVGVDCEGIVGIEPKDSDFCFFATEKFEYLEEY